MFNRRILNHGPDPSGVPQELSLTVVKSCWFELHRQGGCGSGQIHLSDEFVQREGTQIGDWISFEAAAGDRWYLGRVEERRADITTGVRLRLEGMAVELNQMFPGGFGELADGQKPHLYAATDLFEFDPDRDGQTMDTVSTVEELVRLLLSQSLSPDSHLQISPDRIEAPELTASITSLKLRGEESVRALLKDLAVRAQGAAWGVDEQGRFFFLRPRQTILATFREQQDLTALTESQDLEQVFNRMLLTGDYVYDRMDQSGDVARRSYRWRASYFEPVSRGQHGDRRIRMWLPWIRTQADGATFAREFFRMYSQPSRRLTIETVGSDQLPRPWLGRVRVQDRAGNLLIAARPETVRVLFDHVPRFRMELGPADPRDLWPEPPHDERWEIPQDQQSAGGNISVPPLPPDDDGGGGPGGGSSGPVPVPTSSLQSDSDDPSDPSEGSDAGSEPSSWGSTWWPDPWDEDSDSAPTSNEGWDTNAHDSSGADSSNEGSDTEPDSMTDQESSWNEDTFGTCSDCPETSGHTPPGGSETGQGSSVSSSDEDEATTFVWDH